MPSQRQPAQPSAMRLEAEARLAQLPPSNTSEYPAASLLHELQVNQIELQMQNEHLQRIESVLEESRDRYSFLYESAPVAYIALDVSGQITEANRTACSLLGESPTELRRSYFGRLVVAKDQGRWKQNLDLMFRHGGCQECTLDMRRKNGIFFTGHLHYSRVNKSDGVPELHVVLTDITIKENAERTRRLFETKLSRLTRRERDVLALAITGIPNKMIALRLGINQRTVENHRAHIHKKTGVDSLLELAQQAAVAGVALDAAAEVEQ